MCSPCELIHFQVSAPGFTLPRRLPPSGSFERGCARPVGILVRARFGMLKPGGAGGHRDPAFTRKCATPANVRSPQIPRLPRPAWQTGSVRIGQRDKQQVRAPPPQPREALFDPAAGACMWPLEIRLGSPGSPCPRQRPHHLGRALLWLPAHPQHLAPSVSAIQPVVARRVSNARAVVAGHPLDHRSVTVPILSCRARPAVPGHRPVSARPGSGIPPVGQLRGSDRPSCSRVHFEHRRNHRGASSRSALQVIHRLRYIPDFLPDHGPGSSSDRRVLAGGAPARS